jgi:hypothetical protein
MYPNLFVFPVQVYSSQSWLNVWWCVIVRLLQFQLMSTFISLLVGPTAVQ